MKEPINDKEPEFICDKCNKPIYDITELGFLGNIYQNILDCNPFVELTTLCVECTPTEYQINKE
jgi:predicted nucleic-acid-binding Zn-ribbon protein